MLNSTSYTSHDAEDKFSTSNFAQPPPVEADLNTVLTFRTMSPVLSCLKVSHTGDGFVKI